MIRGTIYIAVGTALATMILRGYVSEMLQAIAALVLVGSGVHTLFTREHRVETINDWRA